MSQKRKRCGCGKVTRGQCGFCNRQCCAACWREDRCHVCKEKQLAELGIANTYMRKCEFCEDYFEQHVCYRDSTDPDEAICGNCFEAEEYERSSARDVI